MVAAGPSRDVVQGEDRTAEGESLPFGAVQLLQRAGQEPARAALNCRTASPYWEGTMTTKPSWVDGRVDTLLAELHDLGMSVSRAAATALINERVRVGTVSATA